MTRSPAPAPLVLVVEDEPFILDLIAEELIAAGCTVARVRSAQAALAVLDGYAPALNALVVDVDLGPGPTGYDVARRARRLNPLLPVVYATGRPAEDVAAHGVPGAFHLPKPYSFSRLRRLVAAAMADPVEGEIVAAAWSVRAA